MNNLTIRRFCKALHFAWEDSKIITTQSECSRLSAYFDIIRMCFCYSISSLQYLNEKMWEIPKNERVQLARKIGEDNRKRDDWARENYRNWKFLREFTDIKYETTPSLWEKRRKAYTKEFNAGPGLNVQYNVHIHREHYKYGTIRIGKNVLLAKNVFIDYTGNVIIGDDVSISNDAVLESHEHPNHGDPSRSKKEVIVSTLTIEKGAFIGSRAAVLGSCHNIGRYARIGANSVVVQDIPPYAVVQGNPGKIVGFVYNEEQIVDFEARYFKEDERLGKEDIKRIFKKYRRGGVVKNNLQDEQNSSTIDIVRSIVSSVLEYNISSEEDSTPMNDIDGWGSLANMTIIAEIEEHFGVHFTPDELYEMISIESISRVLELKKRGGQESVQYDNIAQLYDYSPLWKGICENVERLSSKVAIKADGQTLSYSNLYEGACKAAQYLFRQGVRKGDRVVLSAQKNFDYVSFYFASHILGNINIILDPESNEERIKFIEEKVKPKICIGYSSRNYFSVSYEDTGYQGLPLLKSNEDEAINQDDIAEILFTTGTTGQPKGVCLSFANIYGSASNINSFIHNTEDDYELLGLPICHSFAMGRLRCNLLKGSTLLFLSNFANIHSFFTLLEKEGCTGFAMVPAVWSYIRKTSADRISRFKNQLRYIEIGSSSMPKESKAELLRLLPNTRICMHYGLTEASRSTFIEFHDVDHLDSIGKPSSDRVDVCVFDEIGNLVNNGEEGELCVKGNMVLSRYLEDNDNVKTFYGDYFRTGDRGYKGNDGYLYLVGREKEMINVGGKKVSPMEVEDAICSLGVGDCVCVGIPDKKGVMGELVKAYILEGSTSLSFEEISQALSTKLEMYKRPVEYEWIKEIPVTHNGKKKRVSLKTTS